MIFDEPTSGLDGRNMRRAAAYFKEQAENGKAVILITHDYEFVLHCCQKVHILKSKQIGQTFEVSESNKAKILQAMMT